MGKRVDSTRVGGHRSMRGEGAASASRSTLIHPALFHFRNCSPSSATLRAPTNLKDERDLLRFGLGLFSALALLEAERWPLRPHPQEWALSEEGLPILRREGQERLVDGESEPRNPVLSHASLLARLLGAKPAEEGGPWPAVPRRHRSAAGWNAWFAGLVGEDGTASARAGLLSLWELADRSGFKPGIPSAWGIGFTWSPSPNLPKGLQVFGCPNPLTLAASLAAWAGGGDGDGSLRPVQVPDATPYPFSALEPLASAALGEETAARVWMRRPPRGW